MNDDSNQDETNDKFENRVTILHETSISLIKTKINVLFPVGGAIINEFLFELNGRITQARVNKYVDILGDKINRLETSVINLEYLKSEEFFDLTQKVFESASKSNADFKRHFLANIYITSIKSCETNNELKILFSDFINSMTANQINILRFISRHQSELTEIGSFPLYYAKFNSFFPDLNIDKYLFKYYNSDLEAKSLISTGAGLSNFDDTSSISAWEEHREASVLITSLGQKFIDYLTE